MTPSEKSTPSSTVDDEGDEDDEMEDGEISDSEDDNSVSNGSPAFAF